MTECTQFVVKDDERQPASTGYVCVCFIADPWAINLEHIAPAHLDRTQVGRPWLMRRPARPVFRDFRNKDWPHDQRQEHVERRRVP